MIDKPELDESSRKPQKVKPGNRRGRDPRRITAQPVNRETGNNEVSSVVDKENSKTTECYSDNVHNNNNITSESKDCGYAYKTQGSSPRYLGKHPPIQCYVCPDSISCRRPSHYHKAKHNTQGWAGRVGGGKAQGGEKGAVPVNGGDRTAVQPDKDKIPRWYKCKETFETCTDLDCHGHNIREDNCDMSPEEMVQAGKPLVTILSAIRDENNPIARPSNTTNYPDVYGGMSLVVAANEKDTSVKTTNFPTTRPSAGEGAVLPIVSKIGVSNEVVADAPAPGASPVCNVAEPLHPVESVESKGPQMWFHNWRNVGIDGDIEECWLPYPPTPIIEDVPSPHFGNENQERLEKWIEPETYSPASQADEVKEELAPFVAEASEGEYQTSCDSADEWETTGDECSCSSTGFHGDSENSEDDEEKHNGTHAPEECDNYVIMNHANPVLWQPEAGEVVIDGRLALANPVPNPDEIYGPECSNIEWLDATTKVFIFKTLPFVGARKLKRMVRFKKFVALHTPFAAHQTVIPTNDGAAVPLCEEFAVRSKDHLALRWFWSKKYTVHSTEQLYHAFANAYTHVTNEEIYVNVVSHFLSTQKIIQSDIMDDTSSSRVKHTTLLYIGHYFRSHPMRERLVRDKVRYNATCNHIINQLLVIGLHRRSALPDNDVGIGAIDEPFSAGLFREGSLFGGTDGVQRVEKVKKQRKGTQIFRRMGRMRVASPDAPRFALE
jgi:hypothetical protein